MTAKEYLQRYQTAYREAQDTEQRITQLRLKYAAPAAIEYSDMPKAHNSKHDLSDYIVKMDELTDHLISKYTRCMAIEADILERLDMMEKQNDRLDRIQIQKEREVLRMRYIDDLDWDEIADKLHYTYRHVTRLHGTALLHFPMPTE